MSFIRAAALTSLAAIAAAQDVQVLVDDFDNVGWGTTWVTVGISGAAARTDVAGLATGGHDGHGCAQVAVGAHSRLSIRREFGKGFVGNGDKEQLILPGKPSKIGLWVKGNGTATKLVADVSGAGIDFGTCQATEWTFVERDLPEIKESPVRLRSLTFDADAVADVAAPEIAIDDLVVTTRADERTPLFIEFERLGLDHQLASGEPFSTRLRVQNLTDDKRPLKIGVEVTGNKTAVTSSVETLKGTTIDAELAPGEARSWTFDYRYDAGVYNGYLTIADAATNAPIADRRIEYAVFPAGGATTGRDFTVVNSGLSPIVLTSNAGNRLLLFQGLEPYGLAGPARVAFMAKKRPRVADASRGVEVADLSEPWLLFSYQGAAGWDHVGGCPYVIDVPILVVLQHRPTAMKPAGTGVELTFSGECGDVAIVPLYGVSQVRASDTAKWAKGLPSEVVARCRTLAEISREYPIDVDESFKVDPLKDVVTVRDRFEYRSIDDDWGTTHRRLAPLEYMTAMVNRAKWAPLAVQGEVHDLDYAVGQGAWAGVEGVDGYTYTLSGLLTYIDQLEQPKPVPQDDPLLADARRNYNAGAMWGRFHNSWWAAENLGMAGQYSRFLSYLDPGTQSYARASAKALASFSLDPNNIVFEFDAGKRMPFALDGQNYERMGWCDANATSNEGIRNAYAYALGTGDRELVKQRWPFICSYYNVPVRMAHWGDSSFNTGGGDTFGSNLNGTIDFARMAYWVGDDASYRFACYHTAKQLVSLYGVTTVYPKWVVEKAMWSVLQGVFSVREERGKMAFSATDAVVVEVEKDGKKVKERQETTYPVALEDIQFTDLRGGNVGIAPWCQIQRTSDPQERFLKDHCPAFQKYMLDGVIRKWRPKFYQAAYVEQAAADQKAYLEKLEPVPHFLSEHCNASMAGCDLGWHDFFFDVPVAERRARLQRFLQNNGGIGGHEFDIILSGVATTYQPLWDGGSWTPKADSAFRTGLQKVARTADNPVLAIATPKFKWPTLGWGTTVPPKQPAVNSIGMLPICSIVPDETKISFAASSVSPNWGSSTWSADYLRFPVLALKDDLNKLPMYLQSLIIERGLDHVDEHVKNMLAQAELEWNVAGPFPYGQQSDFDIVLPPETTVDLGADYGIQKIGREYHATWIKARASMYKVNFNALYPPNTGEGPDGYVGAAQVCSALWVKCPEERDLMMAIGSDDGDKVWVNGKVAWKNWVHRGCSWDEDQFPIHFRKGWNEVVVKVFNRELGCGFEMQPRFTDRRLLPFGDLEFSSAPPAP